MLPGLVSPGRLAPRRPTSGHLAPGNVAPGNVAIDLELSIDPEPDLGDAQPAIHLELVDPAAREDDLERELRHPADAPDAVAFIGLDPGAPGPPAEGGRPHAVERQADLLAVGLDEPGDELLRELVAKRGRHDLELAVEE